MLTQTRRRLTKMMAILVAAMSLATWASGVGFAQPAAPQPRRPNVLFLMCDQLNASVLSCYGGPVRTPHIDRLANQGVRFNQAVCPTPFCSPTRASIVTGMYPHAHGIVFNCTPPCPPGQEGITTEDVTTEKTLHDAGYTTHHYGKWHLFGDRLPYYPDMFCPNTDYVREMEETFANVRSTDRSGWMAWYNWALPVDVAPPLKKAVDALGDRWKNDLFAEFIGKMGRLKLPLEQVYDIRVGDLTVERLQALAKQDKPFMVTCSFNDPHDPNVVPSPYYESFDPKGLVLPPNQDIREKQFEKEWSRRIVAELGEPGLREFLRIYYGMVKMIDDQVGRILAALDAAGMTDDTIIVFTADHGDMAGEHGMVWKATNAFYDGVVRVPLLIRYPRRFQPQQNELAVDLTDLMPTLLELAGQPIPPQAQGQSLVPYLTGRRPTAEARKYAFSERVGGHPKGIRKVLPGTGGSFMIRGQGWKYVRYAHKAEYLYHLAKDPGETHNLIAEAAYASQRKELSDQMDAWLLRTGWPKAKLP